MMFGDDEHIILIDDGDGAKPESASRIEGLSMSGEDAEEVERLKAEAFRTARELHQVRMAADTAFLAYNRKMKQVRDQQRTKRD